MIAQTRIDIVRKRIIVLGALACLFSLARAGSIVKDFRGEPGYNLVTLRWKSESETNLKGFEIERSFDKNLWEKVGMVNARGNSTAVTDYVFEDRSVFKPNDRTFHYRLKIVDKDNSFTYYGEIVTVSAAISSARQTWGSIKAMFR
jgi:hypothetical protein